MSSQQLALPTSLESSLQICAQTILLLQRRATLRNLQVRVDGDTVELSGTVPTFYDRQVAVTACRRLAGVRELRDRIQVALPDAVAPPGLRACQVDAPAASSEVPSSSLLPHQVHATACDAGLDPLSSACAHAVPGVACESRGWWTVPLRVAMATMLLFACGCQEASTPRQPVFPVKGQLVFKDKPLGNALVVLHPKTPAAGALPARATTDQEGNFQVATYDAKDGALAGEYVITVQHYPLVKKGESFEPGPNSLPPKLAKPETSDLPVVKVADGPVDVGVLKIKG